MPCDFSTEVERKITDIEVVPVCQTCGVFMIRSYTSVGVQFRGSGFYKTDNPK